MACSYSIYLLIMYFNPRIEAWLYKVTNTTRPEYKSDVHASNGNNNGYSQVPNDEADESEKDVIKADEDKDVEKGTPEEEKGADKPNKADVKEHKGFQGNIYFQCHPFLRCFKPWKSLGKTALVSLVPMVMSTNMAFFPFSLGLLFVYGTFIQG